MYRKKELEAAPFASHVPHQQPPVPLANTHHNKIHLAMEIVQEIINKSNGLVEMDHAATLFPEVKDSITVTLTTAINAI
jgi:hypothetical protein